MAEQICVPAGRPYHGLHVLELMLDRIPVAVTGVATTAAIERPDGEVRLEVRTHKVEAPTRRAGAVHHHERRSLARHVAREPNSVRGCHVAQDRKSVV